MHRLPTVPMTPLEFQAWWQAHQNSLREHLMSTLCEDAPPSGLRAINVSADVTTAPELRKWLWSQHESLRVEFGEEEFEYPVLKAYVRRNYQRKAGDDAKTKSSPTRAPSSKWEDTLSNVVSGRFLGPAQFIRVRRNWYRINPRFAC